jgi:hypothetical protein
MLTYKELVKEVKNRPLQEQVSLLQELATVVNIRVNLPQTKNVAEAPAKYVPTGEEVLAMPSPIKGEVPMTKEEVREQYYSYLEEKYR